MAEQKQSEPVRQHYRLALGEKVNDDKQESKAKSSSETGNSSQTKGVEKSNA